MFLVFTCLSLSYKMDYACTAPIEPIRLFHRRKAPIYQRVEIVVPMCAAVIFLLITLIGLSLYCQRRAVAAKIHGSNSRIERMLL